MSDVETVEAAKKRHRCSWCAEGIEAGETYKRYCWFGDGVPGTVKMHDKITRRHVSIGAAIERAAEKLPEGYDLMIEIEKDAGTVTLLIPPMCDDEGGQALHDVIVGPYAPANCMDCPESSVIPDPDPDDWFCDDDCAVVCRKTRNDEMTPTSRHAAERSEYRAVTVACRPYNRRRESDRPEWCPIAAFRVGPVE